MIEVTSKYHNGRTNTNLNEGQEWNQEHASKTRDEHYLAGFMRIIAEGLVQYTLNLKKWLEAAEIKQFSSFLE